MLDKKRIRLMAKMSAYEKKHAKEDLRISPVDHSRVCDPGRTLCTLQFEYTIGESDDHETAFDDRDRGWDLSDPCDHILCVCRKFL